MTEKEGTVHVTQWHPAFCSAIKLTFKEDEKYLSYTTEKPLNNKPLEIDLLIVKKEDEALLHHSIGQLFRKHNVLEYKSPEDELTINTFFKVMAYACLNKAYETKEEPVEIGSTTISFVRMGKPVKLMKVLQNNGFEVKEPYKGIYYVLGDTFQIPIQIIVTRELDPKDAIWLKAIQNNVDSQTAIELVNQWKGHHSEYEHSLIESVMQVSMEVNEQTYNLVKEDKEMCQALLDLMKPEVDAIVEEEKRAAIEAATEAATAKMAKYLMQKNPSLTEANALAEAKTAMA